MVGCEPNASEPKAKGCSAELTWEEGRPHGKQTG